MWILESKDPALVFRILPRTLKTMGRAARADFVVDAPLVSRLHCRLTLDDRDRLEVEDLGSTNGTWVDGRKIKRAPLGAGATLKVGRVEFAVRSDSPAPPTR
jgi:pSer/pThr/pTyr-binding forkhead associated (FHA) protein